jgi:menaquinone-dependent protoporphyrinogen oxidase
MKILIIYGSTEGQTRKIANFLKKEAESMGHQVSLSDANEKPPKPSGYDLILIGASVHMHKYQGAILHYVKTNIEGLNKIPTVFLSVSMATASGDAESLKERDEVTGAFLKEAGWKPSYVEQVAGALLYTQYDFFKKLIMRMIAKRHGESTDTSNDHEYTDWPKLKSFINKLLIPGSV